MQHELDSRVSVSMWIGDSFSVVPGTLVGRTLEEAPRYDVRLASGEIVQNLFYDARNDTFSPGVFCGD